MHSHPFNQHQLAHVFSIRLLSTASILATDEIIITPATSPALAAAPTFAPLPGRVAANIEVVPSPGRVAVEGSGGH